MIVVELCAHLNISLFSICRFLPIKIKLVFFTFNNSLFTLSESDKVANSAFTVWTNVSSEGEEM